LHWQRASANAARAAAAVVAAVGTTVEDAVDEASEEVSDAAVGSENASSEEDMPAFAKLFLSQFQPDKDSSTTSTPGNNS